jgi:hypothetical protein
MTWTDAVWIGIIAVATVLGLYASTRGYRTRDSHLDETINQDQQAEERRKLLDAINKEFRTKRH